MSTFLRRISWLFLVLLPVLCASAQQSVRQPLITQPIDESRVVTLRGNTHPLAQRQFDMGAAPPDLPMDRMLLVLKRDPQQDYVLHRLLDDQQDKNSPNYHQWMTPTTFGAQFGTSDRDIQLVTGWLQAHGFQINRVSNGRSVIEFSGVEAQVEQAFHTRIHGYMVDGQQHWANASNLQIPSALAPVVAGVWTLHSFYKKPLVKILPRMVPARFTPGAQPRVTFPGRTGNFYALGPADLATIYGLNSQISASNYGFPENIAVVARSDLYGNNGTPWNVPDVSDFRNVFSRSGPGLVRVLVDGPDPGDLGGGEEVEATLDMEWAGALAPGASIDQVVSASTNTTDGVDLSELYIIDNNIAPIMTESFGSCEAATTSAEAQARSLLAEQAAAQGITYLVSAGDSGAEGCDDPNFETVAQGPISVNELASSPFVLAVGGTMFNENGNYSQYWSSQNNQYNFSSAISYIPEDVWNQSCANCQFPNIAAGGGGPSLFFSKPNWQSGVPGIPNDGARDIPDVSLTASGHDPYLICLEGSCQPNSQGYIQFWTVAGTSASAPSFAGIMALVDETNGPQGEPGYVLYRLAAADTLPQCNGSSTTTLPATNCVFHDVTVGNNAVPGELGYGSPTAEFHAGTGYDLATGLGSVNITNLVNKWSSVTFNATTTSLVISPTYPSTITHGSPVTIDITVAASAGSGVPTGDVTLFQSGQSPGSPTTPIPANVFPLSTSGTVSATTNILPGGYYSMGARYAGDGTFAPSVSNNIGVTVNPESSATALSAIDQYGSPFVNGPYGSVVYVRADVKGHSGYGTPSGMVNFLISEPGNNNSTVTGALNSQGNTALLNLATTFPPGQTTITGTYAGDPSFNPSTSSPVSFTITQASTFTSLQSAGAPQGAVLTATIDTASLGNPPTGSVTFYDGTATLGSATATTAAGSLGNLTTASLNASQLANGQYNITATYGGDSNYAGSTSGSTPITIQPDFSIQTSTTALLIASPGGVASMPVAMTDLDGFTGTVTFSCSGVPSESKCGFSPASLTTTGTTTLAVTTTAPVGMLKPGMHSSPWSLAFAMLGAPVGALVLVGFSDRLRRARLFSAMILIALFAGCGGGGGGGSNNPPPAADPGTPKGIYVVTLTATSGTIRHATQFGVVVQ